MFLKLGKLKKGEFVTHQPNRLGATEILCLDPCASVLNLHPRIGQLRLLNKARMTSCMAPPECFLIWCCIFDIPEKHSMIRSIFVRRCRVTRTPRQKRMSNTFKSLLEICMAPLKVFLIRSFKSKLKPLSVYSFFFCHLQSMFQ